MRAESAASRTDLVAARSRVARASICATCDSCDASR